MEVNSSQSFCIIYYNKTIKPFLKSIYQNKKSIGDIFDTDLIKEKIKKSFKIKKSEEKNKLNNYRIFNDPVYKFLISRIKRANISTIEKKQLIRLVIFGFKNFKNLKDKTKFVQRILALISFKENFNSNNKKFKQQKLKSKYESYNLEKYRKNLEQKIIDEEINQEKIQTLQDSFSEAKFQTDIKDKV